MYLHNKLNGRGRKLPAPVEVALGLNDTWYVKYKDGRFDHSLATTTADSFDAWTKGWLDPHARRLSLYPAPPERSRPYHA